VQIIVFNFIKNKLELNHLLHFENLQKILIKLVSFFFFFFLFSFFLLLLFSSSLFSNFNVIFSKLGIALQEIYFALSNTEANLDLEKVVERAGPAILDLPKSSKQVLEEEAENQLKVSAQIKDGLHFYFHLFSIN